MIKLYFVSYLNEDGENMDLFITANSPEEALLIFRAEWELETHVGSITKAPPVNFLSDPIRIYEPCWDPTCSGVLSWHDNQSHHHGHVSLVGYVHP
jgi:hypothetical protein